MKIRRVYQMPESFGWGFALEDGEVRILARGVFRDDDEAKVRVVVLDALRQEKARVVEALLASIETLSEAISILEAEIEAEKRSRKPRPKKVKR